MTNANCLESIRRNYSRAWVVNSDKAWELFKEHGPSHPQYQYYSRLGTHFLQMSFLVAKLIVEDMRPDAEIEGQR